MTHAAEMAPTQTLLILKVLSDRIGEFDAHQLVCFAEDASRLKRLVQDETVPVRFTNATALDFELTREVTNTTTTIVTQEGPAPIGNETDSDVESHDVNSYVSLESSCDRLLLLIAEKASPMVTTMPAEILRRLITVFSLLPFRADELVAAVSKEVDSRLEDLTSKDLSEWSIESRIQTLASQAEQLLKTLYGGEPGGLGSAIRSGVSFFFGGDRKESEMNSQPTEGTGPEEVDQIRNVLASIVEVSRRMSNLSSLSRTTLEDFSRYTVQSATLELGRCKELVSHYGRIDFSAGRRRDRHEPDDKRVLAKQVLSRLLP